MDNAPHLLLYKTEAQRALMTSAAPSSRTHIQFTKKQQMLFWQNTVLMVTFPPWGEGDIGLVMLLSGH